MAEATATRSKKDLVVPFHHDSQDALLKPLLDDSKFQELEREAGIEFVRKADGSLKRDWHFGQCCYLLVIKAKDRVEEVIQQLKDLLSKYSYRIIEDEASAAANRKALKRVPRRPRPRVIPMSLEEEAALATA